MKTASRTLVKSPPEVWEQLDHPGRMQGLMSALIGHAAEVDVYEREEESRLCWKAIPDGARIEVEIAEKGWGTNVSVTIENEAEATQLEGWIDAVLDELATPQKRPFEGMTEAPADTLAEAVSKRPEAAEETPVAEAPKPETSAEASAGPEPVSPEPEQIEAVPEPPAEKPPAPERQRTKRRFFIF